MSVDAGPAPEAPEETGQKRLSARHEAVTLSGAAGWALLGGILLASAFVGLHVVRVQNLEPIEVKADFEPADVKLPQATVVRAARQGSFPLFPADPKTLSVDEAKAYKIGRRGKFLVKGDPVIGVEVAGEARAYPLRFLDFHEVINDTVGDLAVVITWSPLSGSAAVFERRVGGTRLEFEPSGLLSNSATLLSDRSLPNSLWSQLHGTPVAGPAVRRGQPLRRVPFQLIRWSDWLEQHPTTRVLKPAEELAKVYKTAPYRNYMGSDELRFPAEPKVTPEQGQALGITLRNKTRVLAVTAGGERRVYPLPLIAKRADASGRWTATQGGVSLEFQYWEGARSDNPPTAVLRSSSGPAQALPSFWFAWHAAYPDDRLAE